MTGKTYTEEEMKAIVEFNARIERLRERAIASMVTAIQRARAAGDTKESIEALQWIAGGIEVLIVEYVHQATTPKQPEEPKPESEAEEPTKETEGSGE